MSHIAYGNLKPLTEEREVIEVEIRGNKYVSQHHPHDRMKAVILALYALEDERIDAILKAFGVSVESQFSVRLSDV